MSSSKGREGMEDCSLVCFSDCSYSLYYLFLVFPEVGEDIINKYNEYTGNSKPVTSGVFINQMVKLQDVHYRRINNYILGQVGIVRRHGC